MSHFLENKKIHLLFYALAVGLATPLDLHWVTKIGFWAFALYVFWIIFFPMSSRNFPKENIRDLDSGSRAGMTTNDWWLMLPLTILVSTRLIPLIKWRHLAISLGADSASYIRIFKDCFSNINKSCLNAPYSYISNALYLLNWNTSQIIYLFYLLLSIFVGVALYVTTKEYFGKNAAFFSFLLFSLSIAQLLVYLGYFWLMMMAIGLLLISFYLINKKSLLAIPVAGFMGPLHLPSFLPFSLSVIGNFLFNKNRLYTLITGIGIIIIAVSISAPSIAHYTVLYTENFGLINNDFDQSTQEFLRGQFIDKDVFNKLVLVYLPFSFIGFISLIRRKQFDCLFFYFLTSAVLAYYGFIFHNRFLIHFDLAAIILAGEPLFLFTNNLWQNKLSRFALIIIFLGSVSLIYYQSWFAEPFLTDNREVEEIQEFSSSIESEAKIITTDHLYRPFLKGFSNKPVLDWNENFIQYGNPLYIHMGEKTNKKTKEFLNLNNDNNFQKVSDHFWKYVEKYEDNSANNR